MLKMLKATLVRPGGQETTVRTYAPDTASPEDVLSPFLSAGMTLKTFAWIDTLSEPRRQWNEEHPDLQIPVGA